MFIIRSEIWICCYNFAINCSTRRRNFYEKNCFRNRFARFVRLVGICRYSSAGRAAADTFAKEESQKNKADKVARVPFQMRVKSNVSEPTLTIPRSELKNLRAQLDALDGGENLAGVGFSQTQTLVGGLFFSLAFIFGGVWIARGKSFGTNQKLVAGLLLGLMFGAATISVFANVAPPPIKGIDGSLFSPEMLGSWRGAQGELKIVVTSDKNSGDRILLEIPPGKDTDKDKSEE